MKKAWSWGLVAAVLTGCGGLNCYDSCYKIYGESECNLVTVSNSLNGQDWSMFLDQCVEECETALSTPGEMGDYNPSFVYDAADPPHLETELQAAAWIDCVASSTCEDLDPATVTSCAPIP